MGTLIKVVPRWDDIINGKVDETMYVIFGTHCEPEVIEERLDIKDDVQFFEIREFSLALNPCTEPDELLERHYPDKVIQRQNVGFKNGKTGENELEQVYLLLKELEGILNCEEQKKCIIDLRNKINAVCLIDNENLFTGFRRMVKDLSKFLGKEIRLVLNLQKMSLGREMISKLREPLLHMVRNAVAHGIEKPEHRIEKGKPAEGKVVISMKKRSGDLEICVEDDGAGIDENELVELASQKGYIKEAEAKNFSRKRKLELIFVETLTSRGKPDLVAGRGLGMDIVKRTVENLGGRISLKSEFGKCTKFYIRLPLPVYLFK
jgi:chemotaxis protein histidine kinase CheA